MKIPPIEVRVPESVDQALADLAHLGSDAQVLAGGQSLLPLLRYRVLKPHVLLDINRLSALREFSHDGGLRIGALVRHSDIENSSEASHPRLMALMRAHAREIAFWPVRNRGTAVGSVVHADPKGDWPLLFMALDARIELRSARGTRVLPVRDFVRGPLDTGRVVDELATALTVRAERSMPLAWGRSKLMHRAGEYALCSALALQYPDGWECWIGAAGDRPFRLDDLSAWLGRSDGGQASHRAALEAAQSELARHLPDANAAELCRHAANMADAVLHATGNTSHE